MTLPLALTASRLVLSLLAGALLLAPVPFHVTLAAVSFVVAAATDFFDGRIARARGQTSELGAFLDPLADKLLVYLSFIYLATVGVYPAWVLLVLFARDIAVDSLRGYAAGKGVSMPANVVGKWKSFFQMLSIGLLLALVAVAELQRSTAWGNDAFAAAVASRPFELAFGATYWLMVAGAAVGLVSMVQYFVEAAPKLFRAHLPRS
jgi:CDP-diacylglycerol--glycerol-3-phosphate 3-phosphatidyltransferase